jgi:hypothetical protein
LLDGRLEPLPGKGPADLVSLARADAFAWIEAPGQEAGGKVRYLPVL